MEELRDKIREFAKERDWDQFHSPKNLSMALAAEAGELLEHFQWLKEDDSFKDKLDPNTLEDISHECADIYIYLIRITDKLGIDLNDAAERKLEVNRKKYPVELAKGNATKYNKR